ncbi:MAG: hypothetical protein MUF00_07330 [Gemmatimonadaceae bacterium]|jgi:hypothetical protein|nr:hypothetical protein [Gemmatimonadaceae bacterium]
MIDVGAWIGDYPFRPVPHPEPAVLVRVLEREGFAGAWVGHLPSAFWRDAHAGNAVLASGLAPFPSVLRPTPVARPDWPGWETVVDDAARTGAPAVRAYPMQWGLSPDGAAMRALADRCARRGRALLLTTRFEDGRQRHPMDQVPDLPAAAVRTLVRETNASVVLTAAGRDGIEEIAWGLTDAERARIWFDCTWLWGPPDAHCAHLFATIGPERFVIATAWPLRLAQQARALLALADPPPRAPLADGAQIEAAAHARAIG